MKFLLLLFNDRKSRENTVIIVIINTSNAHQSFMPIFYMIIISPIFFLNFHSLGLLFRCWWKKRGKIENMLNGVRVHAAEFRLYFSIFQVIEGCLLKFIFHDANDTLRPTLAVYCLTVNPRMCCFINNEVENVPLIFGKMTTKTTTAISERYAELNKKKIT